MTQEERLTVLLERFQEEAGGYRSLYAEGDLMERRTALRSLMNIRPPREMDADTLRVQDDYLREAAREKGIVKAEDLPTVQEQFGTKTPCANRLCLWQGDITRLAADAIVNAANSQMLGCFIPCHNCIDNCIHTYAGIQLRAACAREMALLRNRFGADYEQPTAVPLLTGGYNLPAKHVVHIVGPIVRDRVTEENRRNLADCYRRTLDLCAENRLHSAAFCCISTGVFRFPAEDAADIAVRTVTGWLSQHPGPVERVVFNVYGGGDFAIYRRIFS